MKKLLRFALAVGLAVGCSSCATTQGSAVAAPSAASDKANSGPVKNVSVGGSMRVRASAMNGDHAFGERSR